MWSCENGPFEKIKGGFEILSKTSLNTSAHAKEMFLSNITSSKSRYERDLYTRRCQFGEWGVIESVSISGLLDRINLSTWWIVVFAQTPACQDMTSTDLTGGGLHLWLGAFHCTEGKIPPVNHLSTHTGVHLQTVFHLRCPYALAILYFIIAFFKCIPHVLTSMFYNLITHIHQPLPYSMVLAPPTHTQPSLDFSIHTNAFCNK